MDKINKDIIKFKNLVFLSKKNNWKKKTPNKSNKIMEDLSQNKYAVKTKNKKNRNLNLLCLSNVSIKFLNENL